MAGHINERVASPGPSTATASSTSTPNGVVFVSASRTNATYNSDEFFNADHKGVRLYVDATVVGAGPGTLTVSIQTKDPVTGNWVAVTGATTAALNAVQTKTLTVYPGITVAAGGVTTSTEVSNFIGASWRVVVVVGTNAVTFSVGAEYLL